MTKSISIAALLVAGMASAQVSFAAKAHLLFPTGSASWKNISNAGVKAYDEKGKNNVGFNIGVSSKVDLPFSLFLMPEIYYTTFKDEFTDTFTNKTLEVKYNRIDVPVLLGYNVWGETIGVYVGPALSYNLSSENTYNDFSENAKNNFTVGLQFGAQVKISKLIVDARYEGAFSKNQRDFIYKNIADASYNVRYDNRPSLLMLGVGYKF